MAFFQGLVDYFDKGGAVMWPLLILFSLGVLVVIERFWHYSRATINTRAFLEKIHKVIQQKRIKDALRLCESHRGPIASILKAGLLKYEKGIEEMEKAIEGSGGLEMARLERGLVWLATIANIGWTPNANRIGKSAGITIRSAVDASHAAARILPVAAGSAPARSGPAWEKNLGAPIAARASRKKLHQTTASPK